MAVEEQPLAQPDQPTFDRFSILHFLSGLVLAAYLPLGTIVLLSVVYELVEDRIKDQFPESFPEPSHDRKRNALGDVASVTVGALVSKELL
ncbi:MAG: hypothetical protein AMS21_00875 [Gemmatimonas sp. SG8_38_2]|nr:MAG: hypothetical protein AMS21_00875 [Gemmatimonas sp. SG8_38_2]